MTLDESSLHLQVLSEVRLIKIMILISRYTVTWCHLRERPPYCDPHHILANVLLSTTLSGIYMSYQTLVSEDVTVRETVLAKF